MEYTWNHKYVFLISVFSMIYSVVRTVNLFRDCCCFLLDSETFDLFSYLSFVGSILFSFGVGAGGVWRGSGVKVFLCSSQECRSSLFISTLMDILNFL